MATTTRVLRNEYARIALELKAKAIALEEETARRIAERARDTAPVSDDPDDPTRGSFRDAFRAEGNRVVNDDPAAVPIEFGTHDTPVHATLRNATDAERARFLAEGKALVKP